MLQLPMGMLFKLIGDVHIFRTLQHLRINHIGDYGLIFARKVLIQKLRQLITGNRLIRFKFLLTDMFRRVQLPRSDGADLSR